MPTFRVTCVPRSSSGFALLLASMSWRIRALRSIVSRRGGLVAFWLIGTLCDECSALRLVELD
eukprot:2885127-Pleurochrysis_carterae.AAC.1